MTNLIVGQLNCQKKSSKVFSFILICVLLFAMMTSGNAAVINAEENCAGGLLENINKASDE